MLRYSWLVIAFALSALSALPAIAESRRPWAPWQAVSTAGTLANRIAPPAGFERGATPPGSWATWLRELPLKPAGTPVRLHTGALKSLQSAHAAVIDIDVGAKDLQQCADAIMRLRAEWQWSAGRSHQIAFNYTGGGRVDYARWSQGQRPSPDGKTWRPASASDVGYAAFRKYLEHVMIYAGTASLEKELKPVRIEDMAIGDVFIKGGFPGHAVLVIDQARHPKSGETRFLLAQSYMPAQDIHILGNPASSDGSPWYAPDFGEHLATPEWTFARNALRRWPSP